MTSSELLAIFSQDGIYILSDTRLPGATMAVIVFGAIPATGTPGRGFTVRLETELSRDMAEWQGNTETSLVAGPFSASSCLQMAQEAQACDRRHELAADHIAFLDDLAGRCEPLVEAYGKWMLAAGCITEAARADQILGDFRMLEKAAGNLEALHQKP